MRAQPLVEMGMRALAEQVEVEVGKYRRETVGVFQVELPVAIARPDAIAG